MTRPIPTAAPEGTRRHPDTGWLYHPDDENLSRLTECCASYSSIDDGPLYCKTCHRTVEWGEGDGSDHLRDKLDPPLVAGRPGQPYVYVAVDTGQSRDAFLDADCGGVPMRERIADTARAFRQEGYLLGSTIHHIQRHYARAGMCEDLGWGASSVVREVYEEPAPIVAPVGRKGIWRDGQRIGPMDDDAFIASVVGSTIEGWTCHSDHALGSLYWSCDEDELCVAATPNWEIEDDDDDDRIVVAVDLCGDLMDLSDTPEPLPVVWTGDPALDSTLYLAAMRPVLTGTGAERIIAWLVGTEPLAPEPEPEPVKPPPLVLPAGAADGSTAVTAVLNDGYRLGLAERGTTGYSLLDYPPFDTYEEAQAFAKECNGGLGLTPDAAIKIVLSTMSPRMGGR